LAQLEMLSFAPDSMNQSLREPAQLNQLANDLESCLSQAIKLYMGERDSGKVTLDPIKA
jgi:hypothetical protein